LHKPSFWAHPKRSSQQADRHKRSTTSSSSTALINIIIAISQPENYCELPQDLQFMMFTNAS
jgi:hypothetical protein